jgi:hypothetical protein
VRPPAERLVPPQKPSSGAPQRVRTPAYTSADTRDPGQAVHDEQLASLSDAQLDGLAQAIKDFMDRKRAEEADRGTAQVIPFRPKRKRRP